MLRKLLAAAVFALLGLAAFAPSAHAQRAKVVSTCGTVSPAYSPVGDGTITIDINGNLCIGGTFSATGGTVSNAASAQATSGTNQGAVSWLYGFNGTTWDQLQVDASKFLKINCVTGCAGGTFNNNADAVATSATNGQSAAWGYFYNGTTWDRSRGDTTNGLWVNVKADATAAALLAAVQAPIPAGSAIIGKVGIDQTTPGTTNGVQVNAALPAGTNTIGTVGQLPYPVGAVPLTASATGTTAATTATLAGTTGKTTYICGYSIRANATAATTVTNTITGVITATLSSIMWIAPAASGLGVDEQIFSPCIPASATNTAIAIVSGAPGAGGSVSAKGWGYQL